MDIYKLFPFISFIFLFANCIHEYPDWTPSGEKGIDPTLVNLNINIIPRNGFEKLETGKTKSKREPHSNRQRFIIEVQQENKMITRQSIITTNHILENKTFPLPIKLKLHALQYRLTVWMDYVETEADLYYETSDMKYISCMEPMPATRRHANACSVARI